MDSHSIRITLAVVVLAGLVDISNALRLSAQSPPREAVQPALPVFEIVSVKPNKSGDPGASFGGRPGGQLVVRNNTLRNMIRNAYGLQNYQIVGGPEWIDSDRFDIVAKAADDAPQARMMLMVQTLLADRFKLAVHTETREIPIYALVMARGDGKPGPQLRPASVDCASMVAAARGGGPPVPRSPAGERPI